MLSRSGRSTGRVALCLSLDRQRVCPPLSFRSLSLSVCDERRRGDAWNVRVDRGSGRKLLRVPVCLLILGRERRRGEAALPEGGGLCLVAELGVRHREQQQVLGVEAGIHLFSGGKVADGLLEARLRRRSEERSSGLLL